MSSKSTYEKGRTDGFAECLLRPIGARFGAPTDEVEARVRAAAPAEIEHWLDGVLDAETLGDVFAAGSGTMRRAPLVMQRQGARFTLRRIGDDALRRLARHAAAVEADHAFWLHRAVPGAAERPLSLPEYFVALSLQFGRSGACFDDYKSSFCFPFHLTTAKGTARGDYVLIVEDYKGGPNTRLWRRDAEDHGALGTIQPFVDAEFSRDDYRWVMNYLEGFLQGYLETARPAVADFVHQVDAVLLRYGYRSGRPFEQYAEDREQYDAAIHYDGPRPGRQP
jgi:hypothetical protein